ncbi:MAG: flagellar biosynthesis anti-sigma factor FlgM [Desulfuromonadales bacterium]
MKIDDRISNYMSLLFADPAKSAAKSKENTGAPAVTGKAPDNVSISAEAAMQLDDAARNERLIAIRRQLSEGTYNISGKDVADKMIKILKN